MMRITTRAARTIATTLAALGMSASIAAAQDIPPRAPQSMPHPAEMEPQSSAWRVKIGGTFSLDKLNSRGSLQLDAGGAWDALPTMRANPKFGAYLTADGLLSVQGITHDHPSDAAHPNGGTEKYVVPSVSADALAVIGRGNLGHRAYRVYGIGFPVNLHYSQEFRLLHPGQSVTKLTGGGGVGPAYVSAADHRSERDAAGTAWDPTIQANRFVFVAGVWSGAATTAPALRLDATVPVTLPFVYSRYITYDYKWDFRGVIRGSPVLLERAFDYADASLAVKFSPWLPKETHWARPFIEVYASVATVKVPVVAFERTHADVTALFGVEFLGLLSATEPPQRFDASSIQ